MKKFFFSAIFEELSYLRGKRFDCFMVFLAPIITAALIYWIFSASLINAIPISVIDHDNSVLSRQLVNFLAAEQGLDIRSKHKDDAKMQHDLQKGLIYAAVYIDKSFSTNIKQGKRQGNVVLFHSAQTPNVSGMVQKYVQTAVLTLAAGIEMQIKNKRGAAKQTLMDNYQPLQIKIKPVFNPVLNYEQQLTTHFIFVLLHIMAVVAGATYVGKMFSQSTLNLWMSDVQNSKLAIVAKLIGLFFVHTTPLILVGIMTLLLFSLLDINPSHGLIFVAVASIPFIWLSIAIGGFFAAVSKSQRLALSMAALYAAPAFAFSGVAFPLLSMPDTARFWALCSPYSHFAKILIQQIQMDSSVFISIPAVVAMTFLVPLFLLFIAVLLVKSIDNSHLWESRR